MITSATNPKLKYVRRLLAERRFRQREGVFVVEGTRWMSELAAVSLAPTLLLATAEWLAVPAHQALLHQWGHTPLEIASSLLAEIADTETPPGVLAVVAQPTRPWPAQPRLLLVLDGVRDPGNLGTLIRSAVASGVEGILLGPGCVDAYNPKVVRSSMGALLRVPPHTADWPTIATRVADTAVYVADGAGAIPYTAVDWTRPATLIVGGEAHGASPAARQLAHQPIAIPMHNGVESLNAAVAGSIILFEAVRQRGMG